MSDGRWQKASVALAVLLLALPALGVHAWMAATFPSYLHAQFGQDLVFALASKRMQSSYSLYLHRRSCRG